MRRVLRPQRRLAYAVWGPPDRNPWMTLLVGAMLQNGHQPPGDPFGPGGPFSLADPAQNRALLEPAGFTAIEVEELPGSMSFTDFEDFWSLQSEVSGPIALFMSSLPSDDVAAIRATLAPMLDAFETSDGFEVPSLAMGVSAR